MKHKPTIRDAGHSSYPNYRIDVQLFSMLMHLVSWDNDYWKWYWYVDVVTLKWPASQLIISTVSDYFLIVAINPIIARAQILPCQFWSSLWHNELLFNWTNIHNHNQSGLFKPKFQSCLKLFKCLPVLM